MREAVMAHINPFERMERWELVRAKLDAVAG